MTESASTILVVDDDDDSRDILRALLRDDGYRVVVARNGRLALDVLRLFTPDLIVLDLKMPVLDGWGFDRERSRNPRLSSVPLVVVSAFDHTEGRLYELEAKCFFRKPIDVPLFLEGVRTLLGGDDLAPRMARLAGRAQLMART